MLRYYETILLIPNLHFDACSGCVNLHHAFQQCIGDPETTKKLVLRSKDPFEL